MVLAVISATLALGACQPADSGADESPAPPSATTDAESGATPTPYAIDEY